LHQAKEDLVDFWGDYLGNKFFYLSQRRRVAKVLFWSC
jgi:hypothetical protein